MRTRDSTTVEIVVEGHLDSRWGPVFQGMELREESDGTTTIRGSVPDQAALYGLLRRVRDAGMELVSVKLKEQTTWRKKEYENK